MYQVKFMGALAVSLSLELACNAAVDQIAYASTAMQRYT